MRITLFTLFISAVTLFAQPPQPQKIPMSAEKVDPIVVKADSKRLIRFPETKDSTPLKLTKGQYYVVASSIPLLSIKKGGDGEVTITERKLPLMLPSELAIGLKSDPMDSEFVTFSSDCPYLYVVKASKDGSVDLQFIPAINKVDEKGSQIPLSLADIQVRPIVVTDSGNTTPVDPTPKPVGDPLVQKLQDALDKDVTTPMKTDRVKKLAALYKKAAESTAYDTSYTKVKDLMSVLHDSADDILDGSDKLSGVRNVLKDELNKAFPMGFNGNLDITARELASKTFSTFRQALEKLR